MIRDRLVENTWSSDVSNNEYIRSISDNPYKFNNQVEDFQTMLKEETYFEKHPTVTAHHVYAVHILLKYINYWFECNTTQGNASRNQPQNHLVDSCLPNVFGTFINDTRLNKLYWLELDRELDYYNLQVDRLRAEQATKQRPNMSFINQLYYQLMRAVSFNVEKLREMESLELVFVGEDGFDAGGLIREYFSGICNEIEGPIRLVRALCEPGRGGGRERQAHTEPSIESEEGSERVFQVGSIDGSCLLQVPKHPS
jgi:hypothetical protein